MIKKYIIPFVLLCLGFSLCGCGYVDLNALLDDENIRQIYSDADAYLDIDLTISEEELADVLGNIMAEAAEEVPENTVGYTAEQEEESEEMMEQTEIIFEADRALMFDLVSKMGAGFNIGNSLDSTGNKTLGAEMAWGNPKITPEMIEAIHDKGFDTLRIPVSWGDHTKEAPDYEIDPDWMDRVQEVVDYAYGLGMYVILNTHHEENTWLNTDPANKDAVKAQLIKTWEQIAERFKDYDHKLIFEGMNEPRLKGSRHEWSGGTKEEREVVNELNQAFVDTVRKSGGNNETRPLVVCTYATSAEAAALKDLAIPDDENIIAAVHAYTPYGFTYQDENVSNYSEWNSYRKGEIEKVCANINKYLIENNVPVILDEFGAQDKNNRDDIDRWLEDFLTAANKYGIKCMWWDNGNYKGQGEKFAILNRKDCTWYAESTADILVKMQGE